MPNPPAFSAAPAASSRLDSIDALRGTVMLLMLLDHVRETFYLHHQVSDPVEVQEVQPALFLCRLLAHLCAPVFVLLTGLSAWLYGSRQTDPRRATSLFLLKRGLFLIVLELTLVNFAWTFQWPPTVIYLQVIWAIGLSMVALAGLLWLPRPLLAALAVALIAGHNLFDVVHLPAGSALSPLWSILHERSWLQLGELRLRISYPVLPWIGVISLGYVLAPWFGRDTSASRRQRRVLFSGLGLLLGFMALRALNVYGDTPWQIQEQGLATLMSYFNVTKYPPSLLFLMLTLGIGLLLLRLYEMPRLTRWLVPLAAIGAAPMFFYLLHLYVLKLLYLIALAVHGPNQGTVYGFQTVCALVSTSVVLALGLYLPTRAFARLKARRRDLAWLRYL